MRSGRPPRMQETPPAAGGKAARFDASRCRKIKKSLQGVGKLAIKVAKLASLLHGCLHFSGLPYSVLVTKNTAAKCVSRYKHSSLFFNDGNFRSSRQYKPSY